MKKVVIAISGASGVSLGLKVLEALPSTIQKHCIVSEHAQTVIQKEMMGDEIIFHDNDNIAASISSGSFGVDGMMIIPCSMNTLAKVACGIADNLITRCASVVIKEQKKLLVAPREMPFSPIALNNMQTLASMGVIIAPPVMGYYSQQRTLEDMENFCVGKWLDLFGIENNLYKRWE